MGGPSGNGQAWRRLGTPTWQRGVLWALLLALAAAAAVFDPSDWPYTVGDEGVYAMQAQSLAFDFDRRYEKADYRRYHRLTGKTPDPLILQSVDGGATLVYAKPAFYSLYLAPFVRLAPQRGPIVANFLLLLAAALLLDCLLATRIGADGPLVAAVLLFFSVTFGHVFWIHADLFYLVVTALGLCCLDRWLEDREPPSARLVAGGALVAVAGAGRHSTWRCWRRRSWRRRRRCVNRGAAGRPRSSWAARSWCLPVRRGFTAQAEARGLPT